MCALKYDNPPLGGLYIYNFHSLLLEGYFSRHLIFWSKTWGNFSIRLIAITIRIHVLASWMLKMDLYSVNEKWKICELRMQQYYDEIIMVKMFFVVFPGSYSNSNNFQCFIFRIFFSFHLFQHRDLFHFSFIEQKHNMKVIRSGYTPYSKTERTKIRWNFIFSVILSVERIGCDFFVSFKILLLAKYFYVKNILSSFSAWDSCNLIL